MTREEAIEILNRDDDDMRKGYFCVNDFLAIEVLKSEESCEDCVSREAVLDNAYTYGYGPEPEEYCVDVEDIKALPPVVPTRKWIPCSEKLPEEEEKVLVCNENGDIEISMGSYSTELEGYFDWYTSGWRFGKVVAWKPLPEPYKAESESEDGI